MYRFLLTPRWLAAAALAVAAAVVMVFLGNWQLHRYQERTAINDRIDAAASTPAVPLESVMIPPGVQGTAGPSPGKGKAWTKVTMTGRYDPAHEIQARGRTVDGSVGFEIVTPLVLDNGAAVLVDRGWVPPAEGGAVAAPVASAPPTGTVTVVGQIHLSESRPAPLERRDGRIDTRRIAIPHLAKEMPFPVYGAYVLLTSQTPAEAPGFTRIPIDHEDSWQNGGYAVQWWLFAVMALVTFGWQARKEARGDDEDKPRRDRVDEADRAADAGRPAADRAADTGRPAADRAADTGRPAADRAAGAETSPVVPAARRSD